MRVFLEKGWGKGAWQVKASQGVQTFSIGPEYRYKSNAIWYARMFRKALKNFKKAILDSQTTVQPKSKRRKK